MIKYLLDILACEARIERIMTAAKELNIPKRQVITNGYFSKNAQRIREVAERLAVCSVNDLLLSVDAFSVATCIGTILWKL